MHVGWIAAECGLRLLEELLLLQLERLGCRHRRFFTFLLLLLLQLQLLLLLLLLLVFSCTDAFDLTLCTESAECRGREIAREEGGRDAES